MKNITAGAMNLRLAAIRLLNSSIAATRSQSADRIDSFDRSFSFNSLAVGIVSLVSNCLRYGTGSGSDLLSPLTRSLPLPVLFGTVQGAVATCSHRSPGRYRSL